MADTTRCHAHSIAHYSPTNHTLHTPFPSHITRITRSTTHTAITTHPFKASQEADEPLKDQLEYPLSLPNAHGKKLFVMTFLLSAE
ncbi:uncharacterized protein MONOS_1751 [Monocercomonoides exilis]|uniref:uncharacterized protein n=1 Tax=Monocercomonoides exilis TaxID=2049356 RepID=UPI00355986CA|nr:hypothetical protein MONOS_1751 [Monocercomonoides exilis]|eukprot:MONOS_1751.1-p1 / transcript=MONOS_1751.1 / gene=MONOS_1751 / organism=Monocercomonoides_exilis_PA203 / gene_product=unspecified product / transcript_product=unspecified product / location=Mono_scaffold00032:135151-135408(-) / protein_length=86 / sequence_SO=supercontig / SO=protein_coding / is_pseudo=false